MERDSDGSLALDVDDVAQFRRCPWAWFKQLEVDLSGGYPVPEITDPIRALMGRAASAHRQRVERYLRDTFPDIASPPDTEGHVTFDGTSGWHAAIRPQWTWRDPHHRLTITARVDALIPTTRGSFRLLQTKLGQSTMQKTEFRAGGALAGLHALGYPVESTLDVAFASGDYATRPLSDDVVLWEQTIATLAEGYELWQSGRVGLDWWTTPVDQCGRQSCAWCVDYLSRHDDVFHTSRLRRTLRRALRSQGIVTMEQFVNQSVGELIERLPEIDSDAVHAAHRQASLQVASQRNVPGVLAVEVIDHSRLSALPEVDPSDLYLDFEGDPSYQEWEEDSLYSPGVSGAGSWLGIDYLIGVLDSETENYVSWWSESFTGEAEQFRAFIDFVEQRKAMNPQMKIYHYAGYEQTALQRLAIRHRYGVDLVEQWLAAGVLVDLYREVLASVAIGSPSYSLKKLEPLYFDGSERAGITGGAESVIAFSDYLTQRATNTGLKEAILEYNRVDCVSTKRLHQWMLGLKGERY